MVRKQHETMTDIVFTGLQYYLKEYLSKPLTWEMGKEFLETYTRILKTLPSQEIQKKIYDLCEYGRWPLLIKALPEGTIVPARQAMMTITNTDRRFPWAVGFVESLLLKVWSPITVASCSYSYRKLCKKYYDLTSESNDLDFLVHDFGYRGSDSEESAAITGAAHLLSFNGSDNIPSLPHAIKYYDADPYTTMDSVPASEHSVMCSFGRNNEIEAFRHMLRLYPDGIVSIVSDTFNVYDVLTKFVDVLYDDILSRNGKTVFRPDSGDPLKIICGDPDANSEEERLGCIRLLDKKFGSTINSKGYRVLNPKVGLIYGDSMYYQRYESILKKLMEMGYATSNLVIGVGGILRNCSRDTLGFAIKATYIETFDGPQEIEKDPYTDPGKRSHKGLVMVTKGSMGWQTLDKCFPFEEEGGLLIPVFRDGEIIKSYTFEDMKRCIRSY